MYGIEKDWPRQMWPEEQGKKFTQISKERQKEVHKQFMPQAVEYYRYKYNAERHNRKLEAINKIAVAKWLEHRRYRRYVDKIKSLGSKKQNARQTRSTDNSTNEAAPSTSRVNIVSSPNEIDMILDDDSDINDGVVFDNEPNSLQTVIESAVYRASQTERSNTLTAVQDDSEESDATFHGEESAVPSDVAMPIETGDTEDDSNDFNDNREVDNAVAARGDKPVKNEVNSAVRYNDIEYDSMGPIPEIPADLGTPNSNEYQSPDVVGYVGANETVIATSHALDLAIEIVEDSDSDANTYSQFSRPILLRSPAVSSTQEMNASQ